eukprot:5562932-Alexandrium_andersonii.AAC.1
MPVLAVGWRVGSDLYAMGLRWGSWLGGLRGGSKKAATRETAQEQATAVLDTAWSRSGAWPGQAVAKQG